MTKLEQAARQALGALEVATTPLAKDRQEVLRAITTLREALSGVQALSAAPVVPRMSAAEVNNLPAHVHAYIHQLESLCDPAGMVRENMQLLDTNNALQKMYRRAADACADVFGCFVAAESEGLKGALSDTTDERLKDLVERRLMYAMHAVRDIAASPTPLIGQPQAMPDLSALTEQQAAPKAAPVVWLSSKQLRGVTALHGQYLPFRCQPEGRFDTPVYLAEAAPKAAPGELSDWKPLKTSKEGRDAVRSFFREKLKRHDFDEYIMKSLAADFACVLGGYLRAAPQQEAQEPTEIPEEIERMAADRYKVVPSHESMFHRWAVVAGTGTQQLYLGREVECQNMARKFAGAFLDGAFVAMQRTAPQPSPAPLSESEYKLGYQDGYERRDAEVRGALV